MSEIETVKVTWDVPKEGKEIFDAQARLLGHFVRGGDLAGASKYVGDILAAVQDGGKIVAEAKSQYGDELGGYMIKRNWQALDKDQPMD